MEKFKRTFSFIFNHPLGKLHPLKCIMRFLVWQAQISLHPSKLFVKRFIGNVKFYAKKGLTGITGNIYTGLHEFNDMGFLLHYLRSGDVFFDVGANVGSYTLLAAGFCGVKTFAFEPGKSAGVMLNKNVFLNKLQNNVVIINAAAGSRTTKLTITENEDTKNHIVIDNDPLNLSKETVRVVKVDSSITRDQPSLIKIDVEGFEVEVLKGMTETLKLPTLKALIIEFNSDSERYGYKETDAHDLLVKNNFRPYKYNPFTRELENIEAFSTSNTIYCRDIDFINERVKNAESFRLIGEKI